MPQDRLPSAALAAVAAAGLLLAVLGRDRLRPADMLPKDRHRPAGIAGFAPGEDGEGRRRGGGATDPHGRHADSPLEIPARGWWQIAKRTAQQVSDDRLLTEAAGITFYALLALFPAIAASISIYGLFAEPATIAQHLDLTAGFIPGGGMQIIEEQVRRITAKPGGTLGFGVLLGLGASLWSANQASKAVVDALNLVYGEKEKRGFFRRLALTMGFTLGGILFMLLAVSAVVVVPVVLDFVGLGKLEIVLRLARWPLMLLAIGLFLALLYRYGPSRARAKWRWVSGGSAVASVIWVAGSLLFSWYVENFGSYNETYGSLGAVIGFMTWIWLSATVVLVGAELDAEMEHQTARDSTTGAPLPLGARGARMADRVAG